MPKHQVRKRLIHGEHARRIANERWIPNDGQRIDEVFTEGEAGIGTIQHLPPSGTGWIAKNGYANQERVWFNVRDVPPDLALGSWVSYVLHLKVSKAFATLIQTARPIATPRKPFKGIMPTGIAKGRILRYDASRGTGEIFEEPNGPRIKFGIETIITRLRNERPSPVRDQYVLFKKRKDRQETIVIEVHLIF